MGKVYKHAGLALVAAFLAACATTSYSTHDPRFVGTWYNADYDGLGLYDYYAITNLPNGKNCGYITLLHSDGSTGLIVYKGGWKIKNGHLISTLTASNSSSMNSMPQPVFDTIISVSNESIKLHGNDDPKGSVYTDYRLHSTHPGNICRLVDVVLKKGGIDMP